MFSKIRHATPKEIEKIFGPDVLHIVSGVTKLSKLRLSSSEARQAESIRKMLLAMADDIRVILIKLADRLHNMRTLQYHRSEKKKIKIAKETLDIYAPICRPVGHLLDQERTRKRLVPVAARMSMKTSATASPRTRRIAKTTLKP
jgi:(p)ppGpp synthase/HD superfamily hydrolase